MSTFLDEGIVNFMVVEERRFDTSGPGKWKLLQQLLHCTSTPPCNTYSSYPA